MSNRLEWLTASVTHVGIVPPGAPAPDGQTPSRDVLHTLVLSHGDSGGVAVEGTLLDLDGMLNRAHEAIREAARGIVAVVGER